MVATCWCCLRPIDILDDPRGDLADVPFFRLVRSIVGAGFIAVLHLGPHVTRSLLP